MVRPGMNNVRAFTEEYKPISRVLEAEMDASNQAVFRRRVFTEGYKLTRHGLEDTKKYAQKEEGIFFSLGRSNDESVSAREKHSCK